LDGTVLRYDDGWTEDSLDDQGPVDLHGVWIDPDGGVWAAGGQSRGYWAAFLFGGLALFVFTDRRRKAYILLLMTGGLAALLLIGLVLFDNFISIIVEGVIERFATLGTAITSDVSLVNRFYESMAAWDRIKVNPILGYGMGTRYHYFNLTVDATRDWAFVHNGFVGLWYKFGLVGLGLMLYAWGRSIWNGVRLFRCRQAPRVMRLAGLIAAVCLIGEMLVANTSNPFLIADATLMIALGAGLTSGGRAYMQPLGAGA
jgi:O-antigen ligase